MTPPGDTGAPPPGRRRGRPARARGAVGPTTNDRILAAARAEFAARGYDRTTVRRIARTAAVDPSLVHHYYGTKERVFEAALEVSLTPALSVTDVLLIGPVEEAGERLTRLLFGVWENRLTREPILAVVRSAVTNRTAEAIFRRMLTRNVVRHVASALPPPDGEMRAELAAAQLVGAAMLRYIARLEPLASADREDLIRRLAPVVQIHLTGTPPTPPGHQVRDRG
ncbi:TetR family transcriptional regulator [Streptomyces sp. 184]|uniref:TetR/AcrR family transcriptional regulator n=1 Tax=Streptomyces sp. 184 TaxID=1827526 RepID=UPI003891F279